MKFQRTFEEVHLRRADEASHKLVAGEAVQVARRVDLLYKTVLHYYDARTHGHCFYLVVGYVDEGCLQPVVQFADFATHCGTKFCVQVAEGFVQKEYLWLTHDGTSKCDTLALSAAHCLGFAVEYSVMPRISAASRTLRSISSLGTLRNFSPKAMFSYTVMCG